MAKITSGVYRCKAAFVAATKTGLLRVHVGTLVPYDMGYEVVEGREQMFEEVSQPRVAPVVEQATAAPGEKRATKKSSA